MVGMFLGVPPAFLLNYPKFFGLVRPAPSGFLEWVLLLSSWLGSIGCIWFLITAVLWLLLCKRLGTLNTWIDFGRIFWALLVAFPIMWMYVILVSIIVFLPLDYATPWLTPAKRHSLGLLLFAPFLFVYFAIFLPETPPRKLLLQFWRILKGQASIPHPSLMKIVPALLIAIWLLVVFLPIPENASTHLVVIGGGLAILAYLVLQRTKERRKRRKSDER